MSLGFSVFGGEDQDQEVGARYQTGKPTDSMHRRTGDQLRQQKEFQCHIRTCCEAVGSCEPSAPSSTSLNVLPTRESRGRPAW